MVRLAVILAVLAVFAAACDPQGGDVDPTSTAPAVTPGHTEVQDFNQIVLTGAARAATAGFSGTYTLRATVDGKVIDGAVTWYQKGAQMRADFAGKVAGQQQDVTLINAPNYPAQNALYECRHEDQSCASQSAPEGNPDVVPSWLAIKVLNVSTFAAGLTFLDESAQTILEEDVLCFVGQAETATLGIEHGEVCLTEEGVPLLVTASASGTTVTLAAIEVPGALKEGAFDLPFEVPGQE